MNSNDDFCFDDLVQLVVDLLFIDSSVFSVRSIFADMIIIPLKSDDIHYISSIENISRFDFFLQINENIDVSSFTAFDQFSLE